jgi:hypothetical protein
MGLLSSGFAKGGFDRTAKPELLTTAIAKRLFKNTDRA